MINSPIVCIVLVSFAGIPTIILFNYYLHDRKKTLKIDNDQKMLLFYINKKEQVVKYENIQYIEKIHADDGGGDRKPWRNFYYYRFVLITGNTIEVSRLIVEKLNKKMDSVKFVSVYKFFPLMRR
jgi:hypothetical protein